MEQQPGHQLRRRLHLGRALHESHGGGGIPRQLCAILAAGQMLLERSSGVRPQRAVNVVADENFQFRARHTSTFCLRKTRANSARPRFSRDFTVPSGIRRISAISRYSKSCKSRKMTASRNSGESFCKPACKISLASRPATMLSGLEAAETDSSILARAPVIIDQQIARQPRQPGCKSAFRRPERFQRPVDAQEHLLGEILRLAVLPGKTIAKPINAAGVGSDQTLPGGFVAAQAPLHKAVIEVQTLFYPILAAAVRSFLNRSARNHRRARGRHNRLVSSSSVPAQAEACATLPAIVFIRLTLKETRHYHDRFIFSRKLGGRAPRGGAGFWVLGSGCLAGRGGWFGCKKAAAGSSGGIHAPGAACLGCDSVPGGVRCSIHVAPDAAVLGEKL